MANLSAQLTTHGAEPAQEMQNGHLDILMTANMLIGALVGSVCAYMAFASAPGFSASFTVTMAAIAGATIGAVGGMLIGGLIDIIAGRRLDQ